MTDPHSSADSDVVGLLQALIADACVNDGTPTGGGERRAVETLTGYLGPGGQVVEPLPGRASVVYRIPGTDPTAPTLMLMGHTDVVPVTEAGWTADPFGGDLVDGFIWGRGAVDMLNMTSAMAVVTARVLTGEIEAPAGGLVFLGVADEEAGGDHGVGHLFQHHLGLVETDFLLTEIAYPAIDWGGKSIFPVNTSEKGPSWRKLSTAGTPGHGSTPYGRTNALVPLARAAAALGTEPTPVLLSPEWHTFVVGLGLEEDLRRALLDPEEIDEALADLATERPGLARYVHACTHLTVSPNVLHSGEKGNTIPDTAELDVDIRLLPGQGPEDVDAHLMKVVGEDMGVIDTEVMTELRANGSSPAGPLWEALGDSYERHTGRREMVATMTPATTDARFFRERGVVAYGAGLFDGRVGFGEFLDMFHGNDERISVRSLNSSVAFLETAVEAFGRRTAP